MAFAPQRGDLQISPAVFGGLVTVQAAATLPEGVSPDNQDVAYLPGSVSSRAALQKVFTNPLPATGGVVPTVAWAKTFIGPTGAIENLYLGSDGKLYWEDPIGAPGAYTQFGSVTPGSWAKSITAYGREFIAISDGLHGTDIPLQWDGTNLDRVTQDGPGASPNFASFSLPSVGMVASGAVALTLTEADPAGLVDGNYLGINVYTSSSVAAVSPGDSLILSGFTGVQAPMNNTVGWAVLAVYPGASSSLIQVSAVLPSTVTFWVPAQYGGPAGSLLTGTMVRKGNTVTVTTAAAHQLQVGYQALVAKVPAQAVGGGISAISIVNADNPGIATITTASAHGLIPNLYVSIAGVAATAIGGGVSTISRAGQIVTVATASDHGLSPGAMVTIAGEVPTSFNSTVQVLNIVGPRIFTFAQVDVDAVGSAGGTISINWPVPDTATPSYFQVVSAPTSTTFQVAINYSDGSWSTGTVSYAWNGKFFVKSVPSATSFQYQQYGPDTSTNSTAGTVTPYGQAAPGEHQGQVLFLTRQGAITRGSPPVKFVSSGGQYIAATNIPIGPSNVVARILAFTGASGSTFFYLPSAPQVNGQIVGTETQINDNTSPATTLDFSDPALFAGLGISIPGNDIASQIVLDGALGFGLYGGRLLTWGQRNRVANFLNMSFDGGALPSAPTLPTVWNVVSGTVALAAGRWGSGLSFDASTPSVVKQTAYQDSYGAPIIQPNTLYKFRVWLKPSSVATSAVFSVDLLSSGTGFVAYATITAGSMSVAGSWVEATLNLPTPAVIPSDLVLQISCSGASGPTTIVVDELSIIYAANPYSDTVLYASYVDNPEAFDGVTGKFGSSKDQRKVMDISDIRNTGYFLTRDPGGRLHEFIDNGVTEPAGWTLRQVAANCGLLSAFGLTKSQADDSSASGGEEWFAWTSKIGARIFGGDQPWEISRELQPDWASISPLYQHFCWALNDPTKRTVYFGLAIAGDPQGAATVANRVYSLNYVGIESAGAIGNTGPIKIGFSGKRIATDHSRKWTRWNSFVTLNGAALMSRGVGDLQPVFFGGNGYKLDIGVPGTGQAYSLNPAKYTDDNFGRLYPYYITFMMPGDEMEQAKEVAGFRKMLVFLMAYISAPVKSMLTVTPYADQMATPWPLSATRQLAVAPTADIELSGGQAVGNRIAVKFSADPIIGATDCGFNLQRFTAWMRKARLSVRGAV